MAWFLKTNRGNRRPGRLPDHIVEELLVVRQRSGGEQPSARTQDPVHFADGEGGTAQAGGSGGLVTVTSKGNITTNEGDGIFAWSEGGSGGRGGDGNGVSGIGHAGGSGGAGGKGN